MAKINMANLKMDLILFAIRFAGSVGLYIFLFTVAVLVYWNLEPDPLVVKDTGNNPEIATCTPPESRVFTFERYIKTSKFLVVDTEQVMMDVETGETFSLPAIPPYSGAAGARTITYTKKVPDAFKGGLYEYQPRLTYKVNPIKTITKDAPTQKVRICD
jgi:hypothetical protein